MTDRYLVTGALGCIGAWTVAQLVREGAEVVALDAGADAYRLAYLLEPGELASVERVVADITEPAAFDAVFAGGGITHVIHLAALQVPACRANPRLGAMVNVVGTVELFEAIRRSGGLATPVVYASSVAAYDDADAGSVAPPHPAGLPATHYGVTKRANEGFANVYAVEAGISSIGLRPYVVYGVGRDQGLTSEPTLAMLAAARGEPFHLSYGGRSQLQYAGDVASDFIQAARSAASGAEVYNLAGSAPHMSEVVAAIEAAAPAARGTITYDDVQLPFPPSVDAQPYVDAIGRPRRTPLAEGIAETISRFSRLAGAVR